MRFWGQKKAAAEQAQEAELKKAVNFHTLAQIEKEISELDLAQVTSTTLNPNDLFLMERIGLAPMQVVFGNVVYSMGLRGVFRSFVRALTRGEMYDFSRLNEDARLLARNRMLKAAQNLGATSVIGVVFAVREYADFLEVTAVGTAVRRKDEGTPADQPAPTIAVSV